MIKKIIVALCVALAIGLIYFAYQYFGPTIFSSLSEGGTNDNTTKYSQMSPKQLATINCNLQIGEVLADDFFISNKQLCIDAKIGAGDYKACLDSLDAGPCLAQESKKRKEFLCYIDSEKIGRSCANVLLESYSLYGAPRKSITKELSSFQGIEKLGGQTSLVLKEGDKVPNYSLTFRQGSIQRYLDCDGQSTPDCTPRWEIDSCDNYSRLQGRGNNPEKNQWYYTEFFAIDSCEKVGSDMRVTYTHFKLP